MKEKISLGGHIVEYDLKTSLRARGIRLVVHPEKGLVVTIPKRVGKAAAERFILQKSEWVLKNLEHFKDSIGNQTKRHSKKEIAEYKIQAHALAASRLAHFNQFYNFTYNTISIKAQKTRWGSCSRKGNLNFNYKIVLLPAPLADYIIVHELCHLAQMNHSKKFWMLVAQTVPDYLERRKALRKSGTINL